MKLIAFLLTSSLAFSLSAQSLQDSFNKALETSDQPNTPTAINTFQANVDQSQEGIQLKWDVTADANTDKFIIEKSADKSTWIEVSTVFGASHKAQAMEYMFVDFMPLENLSYYRIIQVSKSGKENVSNTVPVNYLLTDHNTAGFNLFPIALDDEEFKITNIAWEEVFDKEILLVLRDQKGEEFYSKAVINIEDEKLVAVPTETEIPSGNYLITATSENQIYSQNITVN